MGNLVDMTIKDYADLLSSKEPAPGGGSTAALSGVLAASLNMMVANLTFGKKSYEALEEDKKEGIKAEFEKLQDLKAELLELIDEDTLAFNKFMEAMKLPKETDEEKALRDEKMQEASIYALKVPMKTAEKCFEILNNQKTIAQYGNKNAVSDAGVGALLALSGLEGAIMNVNINLPGINDENLRVESKDKCEIMQKEAKELQVKILDIVNSRIG